jgi:predicted nucleic acid-binding protein
VPPTVVAEACYLIDRYLGPAAEAAFLDSVGIGDQYAFQLAGMTDSDLRRMAELVRRYADRRLGGTDASVIALCERLAIVTVATVNLRDFANVRPRHVAALATVP